MTEQKWHGGITGPAELRGRPMSARGFSCAILANGIALKEPWPDFPDATHPGQLLNALPAAIYMTDAAGRITYYNEAAVALWGLRPKLNADLWCGSRRR